MGKSTFKYAWVVNTLLAERERGITINWHSTMVSSNRYLVNFLNGPGHRDYLKNMITCAFMSDFGLLVVASNDEEFEYGLKGHMLEHINILNYLGFKEILICLNKMDLVSYSFERYKELVRVISEMLPK
jgi:translation elongation factor EF-1alpha